MDQPLVRRGGWTPLTDMRVGTKIVVTVLVVAVFALTTGVLAWSRLGGLDTQIQRLADNNVARLNNLVAIKGGMSKAYRSLFVFKATPPEGRPKAKSDTKAGQAAVDAALAAYVSTPDAAAAWQTDVKTFSDSWTQYKAIVNLLIFQDQPPAGVTVPAGAAAAAAWNTTEDAINKSIDSLTGWEQTQAAAASSRAHSTAVSAQRMIGGLMLAGVVIALALALFVGRSVSRRLLGVRRVLDAVADGDLTQRTTVTGADEVGAMAGAVNRASDSIRQTVSALAESAQALAGSSRQLSASAESIAQTAQETSSQTGLLAAASEDVSTNVHTVAAGTEEMGSAIREISQSANDAAGVAAQAVTAAAATNAIVAKLGDSSAEIGNVVKVITSIAEQTNLLALNATIEAARAGELGKGFAVVAGEVKDLAQETAKATEDISRRVQAIQADTGSAVLAIEEISRIIAQINDYQTTIASAVEEQTATTNEMSRSIGEASSGSSNIAGNIASVAAAAQTTTTAVGATRQSAAELAQMSADLQARVATFRI